MDTSDARRLLRHLNDPRELRKSPLAQRLLEREALPRAQANAAVAAQLREIVARALARMEPSPASVARSAGYDRRLHAILTRCDLAGEKHEVVARELGLSLRQFYRDRGSAFERFSEALREELVASDALRDSGTSEHLAGNLPWQATSFVGRERELEEIAALLAPRRLVTVTGPGGTGKTRTALEVASRCEPPPGGVWFVDLAAVHDGAMVANKLATTLDARTANDEDVLPALLGTLRPREATIVLDNCEHLIESVRALVNALLGACPNLRLLATSRQRIDAGNEAVYRLSTLDVPTSPIATAAEARAYAAIELFAQRASSARHGTTFAGEQWETIAAICRKLDGLPLAIELAAARFPVLGLEPLRAQLQARLSLIARDGGSRPARHQTLGATIAWSYDLLDAADRTIFRRLAVFEGGWTLDAAVEVCRCEELTEEHVIASLLSLAERSLVVVDTDADQVRYSFLESTHAFAVERLEESGERLEIRRRHARWAAAYAQASYDAYMTMPRLRWEALVEPEIANALAAMEWGFGEGGDPLPAAHVAAGLQGYWIVAGFAAVGRRYVAAALERVDERSDPALTGKLLIGQATFLYASLNIETIERAVALFEREGDLRSAARAYIFQAFTFQRTCRAAEALAASDRALDLLQRSGLWRTPFHSRALSDRSAIFALLGREDERRAALQEALEIATEREDPWTISFCEMLIADAACKRGDLQEAIAMGRRASETLRRFGQEIFAMGNLAAYYFVAGDLENADRTAREVLQLSSNADLVGAKLMMQLLAAIAAMRGDAARAALLVGHVNAGLERLGLPRDDIDTYVFDALMRSLHATLDEATIAQLGAQGAALSEEAAIEKALGKAIRLPAVS